MGDSPKQVVGPDRHCGQRLRDLFEGDDRLVEPMRLELGLPPKVRVLDHQGHLGRDRLQQFDVLQGQPVSGGDAGDEVTGVPLRPDKRDDQRLLRTRELAEETQAPPLIAGQVGDGLDAHGRFGGKAFCQLRRTQPAQLPGGFRRETDHGPDFEPVRLVPGEQQRRFEPQGFHADAEDDFGHRAGLGFLAQTLAGLRQSGKTAHLLVQRAGALLQILSHGVERGRQLAELIATPDLQPFAEVTPGHRLGPGNEGFDRPGEPEREQVADQEQDQDDARKQYGHLECRLETGLDHAAPRQRDREVPLDVLAEVEVRELEFVFLAGDGHASGRRAPGGGQRQVRAEVLVDEVALHVGDRAAQQPPVGIQ